MENLKFNYKKCLNWINAIENDFSISLDTGNYIPYGYGLMNLTKSTSVKEFLLEVLIEFKDKSIENNDSDFLKLVSRRYEHWEAQQFRVISSINNLINVLSGIEKEKMEESKDKHMEFCHFNYDLLKMIKSDVLNGYQYRVAIEKKPKKIKQPKASVIMKVFALIDNVKGITKNECKEMLIDEKVEFIRNWINENLGYNYEKSSTLKKEQYSIEGYNLEVENVLKEKGFSNIATQYKLYEKSN